MARRRPVNEPSPVETDPEPWLIRHLPFHSVGVMGKIVGGTLGFILLVYFTHWSIIFPGLFSYIVMFRVERKRRQKQGRVLIEVRLQGHHIRNVPKKFTVPHSRITIWSLPPEVYETCQVYGDPRPMMNTGSILVCDYFDPWNRVIVYPDDQNWANWLFLTHTNDEIGEYFQHVLQNTKSQERIKRVAMDAFKRGDISAHEAYYAIEDAEATHLQMMRNPKTFRNLFLYYKDTIPFLQHLLWEIQARFEERAHMLGAAYSLMMHGLPLKPELVKVLPLNRRDYDRIGFSAPRYEDEESPVEDTGMAEEGSGSEPWAPGTHMEVERAQR